MKRIVSLLLVCAMMLTMAACGGSGDADSTTGATETTEETTQSVTGPESALEVLENIWNAFPAEEQFSVYGGDMETHAAMMEASTEEEPYEIPNAPGKYDMTYAESLPYILLIPEEQMANVDEAATMIHMMLANNFTSGVVHLTEGTDVADFTAAVHEAIMNNPWMCGFPEKELVAVVGGEYVLIAFGVNDAMTPFQTHFQESYPDAQIAYNEDLA